MYSFLILLVNILLVFNVFCKNVHHRDPRFLRGSVTSTWTSTIVVTKSVPSSCVQVEPTLPPCRNVRFMRFPMFNSNEVENGDARPEPKSSDPEPPVYTTPLGWGEYLGVYAPTVTVNVSTKIVTTVVDPRIVVTFAVKGCRPMKLPTDMSRCPREYPSALPIQEILPTSTVVSPARTEIPVTPKNTKIIDLAEVPDYGFQNVNDIQANEKSLVNSLESSKENTENFETPIATEPLP